MNISELYVFSEWLSSQTAEAGTKYKALSNVLKHNATQPQKQPVSAPAEELIGFLKSMDMNSFSNEQMRLASIFDIDQYIGVRGGEFVERVIKSGEMDPATASEEISAARDKISKAHTRVSSLKQAFDNLDMPLDGPELGDDRSLIRVQFKNAASVDNVVSWKEWSSRWHDIARGVAMAVGDAPENVLVVGATRGSLIMEMAGTYVFVRLLAGVSKSVVEVALQVTRLYHSIEDLRTKSLLNDRIEKAIKQSAEDKKKVGVESIIKNIKSLVPKKLNGEQEIALTRSIEKLVDFHEKGGEIDFVAPPEDEEEGEAGDGATNKIVAEIRSMIEEFRSEKAEMVRLIAKLDGVDSDKEDQVEQ